MKFRDRPLPWWFSRTHWLWRRNQIISIITHRQYENPGTYKLVDLPCGCQDIHYADGRIDHEHDHVHCDGKPLPPPPDIDESIITTIEHGHR